MSQKRALVAGGAGFIGSHLTQLLLQKNYEVVVLDNFVTGQRKNLNAIPSVTLLEKDLRDFRSVDQYGKFDEIYNLASPASPVDFERFPIFILETASIGHKNLLEIARAQGARILFASTSEVYGDPLVHPQIESYFGNVNPIGPRSCYDEAKRYGEALSVAYHREFKVDIRISRIFNTYGPRMRPDDGRIIPNFMMQALQGEPITLHGDGMQTRSFCYVDDLCRGLYALMQSSETTPVNIGNEKEVTVKEIAERINALTGNKAGVTFLPGRENDPKMRRPNTEKAKRVLNWTPEVSLETGLERTLEFFRSQN